MEHYSIFLRSSNASYWRGFNYYESGFVFDLKTISDDIYEAKVKGTKEYDVHIELNHPNKCTCTCPFTKGNHKVCKHMIAVAFSVVPDEVKTAKKSIDDYFKAQARKEKELRERVKRRELKIRNHIDSLTEEEVREELFEMLMRQQREIEYDNVYDDEDDEEYEEFY